MKMGKALIGATGVVGGIAMLSGAANAQLTGTSVNGSVIPRQSFIVVTQPFVSPATVGPGVEFSGGLRANFFNFDYNISSNFSDRSLIIRITSPQGQEIQSGGAALYGLSFSSPSSLFPSNFSTITKSCAANSACISSANSIFSSSINSSNITIDFSRISDGDIFTLGEISAAPEPSTWLLMILGFGLTGAALRRQRYRIRYNNSTALAVEGPAARTTAISPTHR